MLKLAAILSFAFFIIRFGGRIISNADSRKRSRKRASGLTDGLQEFHTISSSLNFLIEKKNMNPDFNADWFLAEGNELEGRTLKNKYKVILVKKNPVRKDIIIKMKAPQKNPGLQKDYMYQCDILIKQDVNEKALLFYSSSPVNSEHYQLLEELSDELYSISAGPEL